jgi:hypothetical protein
VHTRIRDASIRVRVLVEAYTSYAILRVCISGCLVGFLDTRYMRAQSMVQPQANTDSHTRARAHTRTHGDAHTRTRAAAHGAVPYPHARIRARAYIAHRLSSPQSASLQCTSLEGTSLQGTAVLIIAHHGPSWHITAHPRSANPRTAHQPPPMQ